MMNNTKVRVGAVWRKKIYVRVGRTKVKVEIYNLKVYNKYSITVVLNAVSNRSGY